MATARITITAGNIGRDAESKQVGDHYVVEFPVAVNDKRGGQERTSWFRCKVWNDYARLIESSLLKGERVSLEGRLSIDEWTDRDGNKRTTVEVSADSIHVAKREQEQTGGRPPAGKPEEPDDDIPF